MNWLQVKNTTFKIIAVITIGATVAINTGCKGPGMSIIGSWVNKEKMTGNGAYNSVFIAALTQNMAVRSALENNLAAAAQADGIKAVQSLAAFTPVTGVPDSVVAAAFVKTVKASGCKSVLLVSMLDSKTETKYIPGHSYTYNPYPYYGYYGTFYDYYNYTFNTISTPGYYKTDNTYYIESNLYDVDTQGILFSIQTKTMNPSGIEKSTQKFTTMLIDELKSNGLLKKE